MYSIKRSQAVLLLVSFCFVATSGPALAAICETDVVDHSSPAIGDQFGFSVALDGTRFVAGAIYRDPSSTTNAGAAYIYDIDGSGNGTLDEEILASDKTAQDEFGCAVAIDGLRVAVGASKTDDTASDSGSVYIFDKDDTWTQTQEIHASDAAANDRFGFSVAIDGNWIVVGAPSVGSGDAGAAYVFEKNTSGTWDQQAKLTPSNGDDVNFGWAVAIDGNCLVVGAPNYLNNGNPVVVGALYVFCLNDDTVWSEQARKVGTGVVGGNRFAAIVDIEGDFAIAGSVEHNSGAGAAWVFDGDSSWAEDQKLTAGSSGDAFGSAVSVSDVSGTFYAFIGSHSDDNSNGTNAGSAYVFKRGATWSQEENPIASDGAASENFGRSIALDGDVGVVGALKDIGSNILAGGTYLFDINSACP